MIKNFLTRYYLRYPRTLVYMLQASEYNIGDYLRWYEKTKNFSNVERRKHLVKTPKSVLLLIIAWICLAALYGLAISILWLFATPFKYILFIFDILVTPILLAYGILIPLFLIKVFIQIPIEYIIIKRAKKKLKLHKAVKIAIAGSFGKTTMREILRTVLSEGKLVSAPPHSYNTPLGISKFVKSLKGDEEVLVFEFGEYYPGDVRKLCRLVGPDIGVITGVNEAHFQRFKSIDATVKTIFELADWLGEKPIYVNGENTLARDNAPKNSRTYSRNGVDDWTVENAHTDLSGTSFVLRRDGNDIDVKSHLLGLHQVGPLVAAADIAFRLGVTRSEIKAGINNTKPFNHRLEPRVMYGGATVLDDSYNGNPDGVNAVIDFLSSLKGSRRIYVTPGLVEMGERTGLVHREIGKKLAKSGIEKVVLIKNSVTHYIEQGLNEFNYKGEVLWFDDALAVLAALPYLAAKGDVVLLQNDWPDQYQ